MHLPQPVPHSLQTATAYAQPSRMHCLTELEAQTDFKESKRHGCHMPPEQMDVPAHAPLLQTRCVPSAQSDGRKLPSEPETAVIFTFEFGKLPKIRKIGSLPSCNEEISRKCTERTSEIRIKKTKNNGKILSKTAKPCDIALPSSHYLHPITFNQMRFSSYLINFANF